jgi:hypothetical protein
MASNRRVGIFPTRRFTVWCEHLTLRNTVGGLCHSLPGISMHSDTPCDAINSGIRQAAFRFFADLRNGFMKHPREKRRHREQQFQNRCRIT